MDYTLGGDLHKYHLQKNFREIKWKDKLNFLISIIYGLYDIHDEDFIHRDFHSGNVLIDSFDDCLIPYIAPEIFKGSGFSKESDINSLGIIMWKMTTDCKPFANFEHDHSLIFKIIDGVRPEITKDTPECYANLMKSCWDPDPQKRSSINKISNISGRSLLAAHCIFSKCSTINFTSNDYISEELKLDIHLQQIQFYMSSGLNSLGIKRNIEELNINSCENDGKRIKN
ncbi:kinase-like domain-containing protein [Rhizophagus diaphanus]|nr:kinase-like domain-containing protein [Rhizophagus diaphanus] [Rhizophagus sp. MUCL 43196]